MQTIRMESFDNYRRLCDRVDAAAQRAGHAVRLLAVSKMQPAAAVRAVATLGQSAFGENYVQEGLKKQRELADLNLEWHAIGPLQSNKCREIAVHFDWLQSLDRAKLIEPLNRARADAATPLQVLIQINIDNEAGKSGCVPDQIDALAAQISAAPHLALRGLMAIPAPGDPGRLRAAFAHMRELYLKLRRERPEVDTLSMGMSADFEVAIAEGATLVRIGSALFGARG